MADGAEAAWGPYSACVRQTGIFPDMHRAYVRQVPCEPAGSAPMKPYVHGRATAYLKDNPPHTGDSYVPIPPHLPHARQKGQPPSPKMGIMP